MTSHPDVDVSNEAGMRNPLTRRVGMVLVLAAAVVAAATLQILDANPATSQTTGISALKTEADLGLDPGDGAWDRVPETELPLTAQQTSYPFGGGSVAAVTVQALHDEESLYLRVTWPDSTSDVGTGAPEAFSDAVAVQFPSVAAATVPAVCMGQASSGVNIWQWRADSDAGPPDTMDEIRPNTVVDVPETANEDYPARVAGNPFDAEEAGAVQNLLAEGFGTIGPAEDQPVAGHGEHDDQGWTVVLRRELSSTAGGEPSFRMGEPTDMAFAVWDGANDERNGLKSVSAFATLALSNDTVPGAGSGWIIPLVAVMLAAVVIAIARGGMRRSS